MPLTYAEDVVFRDGQAISERLGYLTLLGVYAAALLAISQPHAQGTTEVPPTDVSSQTAARRFKVCRNRGKQRRPHRPTKGE